MRMDSWDGYVDLLAVPLDDFELILGVNFLKTAKAAVIPHLGGLLIMDEERPCFVAGVHKRSKGKEPLLSAMQVEHGLKRGEPTFMAALLVPSLQPMLHLHGR